MDPLSGKRVIFAKGLDAFMKRLQMLIRLQKVGAKMRETRLMPPLAELKDANVSKGINSELLQLKRSKTPGLQVKSKSISLNLHVSDFAT